uniref:Uncharacterized protein n=1 Tax=Romanomermis culicivorax TaxID=13658 RepID=A0A915L5P1_ROMCU
MQLKSIHLMEFAEEFLDQDCYEEYIEIEHSFVYVFYDDFHTYNDERFKHVELYQNYTGDYGCLK